MMNRLVRGNRRVEIEALAENSLDLILNDPFGAEFRRTGEIARRRRADMLVASNSNTPAQAA